MEVENKVMPNNLQMAGFLQESQDGPIFMVNLLKFKDRADYPDGRETSLSGQEAYALYAQEAERYLERVGGDMVFYGDVSRLVLGEVEELWDQVAIAMFPSRRAMLDMMSDQNIVACAEHRFAGLEGQLNIETRKLN